MSSLFRKFNKNKDKKDNKKADSHDTKKEAEVESKAEKAKIEPEEKVDASKEKESFVAQAAISSKKVEKPKNPTKPIVVSFVCDGHQINNDFIFSGEVGTKLTQKELPQIEGYRFDPKNKIDLVIGHKEQKIKLNYIKQKVKCTLVPATSDSKVITNAKTEHYEGQPGSVIPKDQYPIVKGYDYYNNRQYKVPSQNEDVKIFYVAKKQSIHVAYKTKQGEVLANYTKHGKTGETYKINPERHSFPGYQLAAMPQNLTGQIPATSLNVDILLEPVTSKVIVDFVEQNGNKIHDSLEISGHYKDPYKVELPTIDGYELISNPSLLNGFFEIKTSNIVLVYKKATVSFKINYWFDEQCKHSAGESTVLSGINGDNYKYKIHNIDGYVPSQKMVTGKYDVYNNHDIDVFYTKIQCIARIVFVDESERPLPQTKQVIKKGLFGSDLVFEIPEIPGFRKPFDKLETKFKQANQVEIIHYAAKEVKLTVNYIDERTNQPIKDYPSEQRNGLAGTAYSVEAAMIDGYTLTQLPDNANGVYTNEPIVVNLVYTPNPSKIVIHRNDETLQPIGQTETIDGYFGQPYEIPTNNVPGYTFEHASADVKGVFPTSRLDIYLYFTSEEVTFYLVPVDQFGEEIDSQFNIEITGRVGQNFSHVMQSIPGYVASVSEISGLIKAEYAKKKTKIPYVPQPENITIHTVYTGGDKDGMHPFNDITQPGLMGELFEFSAPKVIGYEAKPSILNTKYIAEDQELTITYSPISEKYLIQYIDTDNNLVGGMPEAQGYFALAIDIAENVPKGFRLPESTDRYIYLNGSNTYKVTVEALPITTEFIAKTKDENGNVIDLGARMQKDGHYDETRTFEVMTIPGYQPVNGEKIKVKFSLDKKPIQVFYEPETRSLTVSLINAATGQKINYNDEKTGKTVDGKFTVKGKFNEEYKVVAPDIPGYRAINRTFENGTFGLNDTEMAFLYTAKSDIANPASTDFQKIVDESNNQQFSDPKVVHVEQNPEVETQPFDNIDRFRNEEQETVQNENQENSKPTETNDLIDELYGNPD